MVNHIFLRNTMEEDKTHIILISELNSILNRKINLIQQISINNYS